MFVKMQAFLFYQQILPVTALYVFGSGRRLVAMLLIGVLDKVGRLKKLKKFLPGIMVGS